MKDRGNRQKRNAERKERRRIFLWEVNEQLKEHRRSFVVYSVLRILVIVTMVRQFMLGFLPFAFSAAAFSRSSL